MAAEDPLHVGPWEKDRVLGTGGFGIVTLWKNKVNQERVGKHLLSTLFRLHYTSLIHNYFIANDLWSSPG